MVVRRYLCWSETLRYVGWPLFYEFLLAVAVTIAFRVFGVTTLSRPDLPLGLIGAALTVFLGFRNNSAYDRWWEARTLWGQLVNTSRSFTRQMLTFPARPDEVPDEFGNEVLRLHIAYVHALRLHLRKQEPWSVLSDLLPERLIEQLRGEPNVPAALAFHMGERIRVGLDAGYYDSYRFIALDTTLKELMNIQGGCERIKNTPLPRQYSYFPSIFIRAFCFLLPFGLIGAVGVLTPVVTLFIAFIFVALDRIGESIETPFENTINDTPMSALSRNIEIEIRKRLGETKLPEPMQPVNGYLY